MQILFTLYTVFDVINVNAAILFHAYIYVSIAIDIGLITITSTEDTEVWRTSLVVHLFPFLGSKETTFWVCSCRYCFLFIEHALGHCYIRVATNYASEVSTTIHVMVHLELTFLWVILWRVQMIVSRILCCSCPCTKLWLPKRGQLSFTAIHNKISVSCNIRRSFSCCIAQTSGKYIIREIAIINLHKCITVDDTLVSTTICTVPEIWNDWGRRSGRI